MLSLVIISVGVALLIWPLIVQVLTPFANSKFLVSARVNVAVMFGLPAFASAYVPVAVTVAAAPVEETVKCVFSTSDSSRAVVPSYVFSTYVFSAALVA